MHTLRMGQSILCSVDIIQHAVMVCTCIYLEPHNRPFRSRLGFINIAEAFALYSSLHPMSGVPVSGHLHADKKLTSI